MAGQIARATTAVAPVVVPLDGFNSALAVRADPTTNNVDVLQAFQLVLGEECGKSAFKRSIAELFEGVERGAISTPSTSSSSPIQTNAFTRVRWISDNKKQGGWGSVVAPLHAVVQMLMLNSSSKTKAIRATAARTTLRAAGGDLTLAAQVVANNQALEGTHAQQVLLNDTTSAPAGPLITTEDRQVVVYQQRMDAEFELFRQKLERQEAKEDAERKAEREKREATALIVFNAEMEKKRSELDALRRKTEREETEHAVALRDRLIRTARAQRDMCTDEAECKILDARLEFLQNQKTDVKILVDRTGETPSQPLLQTMMARGDDGTILDYRLQTRFDVVSLEFDRTYTLEAYLAFIEPRTKLTKAELVDLGKRVAATYDEDPRHERPRIVTYEDDTGYRVREYPLQVLNDPPVKTVIDVYLKAIREGKNPPPRKQKATVSKKRKLPGAFDVQPAGPSSARGPLDSFVVHGQPV